MNKINIQSCDLISLELWTWKDLTEKGRRKKLSKKSHQGHYFQKYIRHILLFILRKQGENFQQKKKTLKIPNKLQIFLKTIFSLIRKLLKVFYHENFSNKLKTHFLYKDISFNSRIKPWWSQVQTHGLKPDEHFFPSIN